MSCSHVDAYAGPHVCTYLFKPARVHVYTRGLQNILMQDTGSNNSADPFMALVGTPPMADDNIEVFPLLAKAKEGRHPMS